MNKEKQIEEMYKDVYDAINHNAVIDITHGGYIGVNTEGLTRELYDDGYRRASEFAKEIDDLVRHILLNEDIAIKCKRENGSQNEEYWKGKISAYREIRTYIDVELKKKWKVEE